MNADVACPPTGLSPRVRGNPGRRRQHGEGRGSIPACAGEPISPIALPIPATVYPRVCGGTGAKRAPRAELWGLSPRVRGNPLAFLVR